MSARARWYFEKGDVIERDARAGALAGLVFDKGGFSDNPNRHSLEGPPSKIARLFAAFGILQQAQATIFVSSIFLASCPKCRTNRRSAMSTTIIDSRAGTGDLAYVFVRALGALQEAVVKFRPGTKLTSKYAIIVADEDATDRAVAVLLSASVSVSKKLPEVRGAKVRQVRQQSRLRQTPAYRKPQQ